jgi:hypothetical protein
MTLRIETHVAPRSGSSLNSSATVEWIGRIGHPSSYAVLGGHRFTSDGVQVFTGGAIFKESLAGSVEEIRWGLPREYEDAISEILSAQPVPVTVSKSAYGQVSSSAHAFRTVALMLCRILGGGLPSADHDVWKLYDSCHSEADVAR